MCETEAETVYPHDWRAKREVAGGRSEGDGNDEALAARGRSEFSRQFQTFWARRRGVMRVRDWRALGFVRGPPAECE